MEETTSASNTTGAINSPLVAKSDQSSKINTEWVITLLLAIFLGTFGVHRFYTGKIGTGILMLVTCGGFGIWALVDTIVIAMGNFEKKDGTVIKVYASL